MSENAFPSHVHHVHGDVQQEVLQGGVSKREWYNAIQETCQVKDHQNCKSEYKKYPTIWKMATKYVKFWEQKGWDAVINISKNSHFKTKVVSYIVDQRETVSKSLFRDVTNLLTDSNRNLRGSEIMLYLKESFEEHASETWKVDKQAESLMAKATINDTIRLFEVAAMDIHRDDLTLLTRGRADNRSHLDGAKTYKTEIFGRWKEIFEDESQTFQRPEKIRGLSEFDSLNPNELARIKITRDVKFYMALYKHNMAEFKISVKKWTSDTGGGSGNPLHMHSWNDASLNDFANYGGGQNSAVRKVWFTYLLILDIQTQYGFSASFSPPPPETVLEDGVDQNKTHSRTKQKGGERDGIEMLCETVGGSVKELAKAMVAANAPAASAAPTAEEKRRKELEDLDAAISLNTKLEKQRSILNRLPDDDKLKKMKLYVNEKAIKKAARLTLEVAKIPSDTSSVASSSDQSFEDDSSTEG